MTRISPLTEMGQAALAEKISSIINSSRNPELAKAILFKMHHSSGHYSGKILSNSLELPEQEVDLTLQFLNEHFLVSLKEKSPEWGWEIWRQRDAENYIQSELPYGPRTLFEMHGLTDESLLKAMRAIQPEIKFHYQKRQALDIDKLRDIGKDQHTILEKLMEKEKDTMYKELNINRAWAGLPSFIKKDDPTREGGYDNCHFTMYGDFDSPEEAIKENFESASASPPMKRTGHEYMDFLKISRTADSSKITLKNSRYYASGSESMRYMNQLDALLLETQSRLEKALGK